MIEEKMKQLALISRRSLKMIEEKMKQLALAEFGTLDGVKIQYWVNPQTGYIQYCIWRR